MIACICHAVSDRATRAAAGPRLPAAAAPMTSPGPKLDPRFPDDDS